MRERVIVSNPPKHKCKWCKRPFISNEALVKHKKICRKWHDLPVCMTCRYYNHGTKPPQGMCELTNERKWNTSTCDSHSRIIYI